MASESLNIANLGEQGYLPDVAPANLPPNGVSYSKNFRYREGLFAEVSPGYSNALDSRDKNTLGDSDTVATFLWTWLLNDSNAFIYYDTTRSALVYVEQNSESSLVEFVLSYENTRNEAVTYIDTETLTATQFTVDTDNHYITLLDTDGRDTEAKLNAEVIIYNRSTKVAVFSSSITAVTTVGSNLQLTYDSDDGIPNVDTDTDYQLFFGTRFEHDPSAEHKWSATDALGIPVFNNTIEAPWEFRDAYHPYVDRLTNWPEDDPDSGDLARCEFFTSFGSRLVAIAYRNAAAGQGYQGGSRVAAISDIIVSAGELPQWDFANPDSFAQLFDFSLFTDGSLVSAAEANNTLYINTLTTVISMVEDGAGGFTGTKLPIGGGCLAAKTSVAIPNGFFTIGNGIIYRHDGNSFQEIGDGKWSNSWFDAVDEDRLDEIQCLYNPREHEVWLKTPTSANSQEVWIYNINADTISPLDDHEEIGYMTWSADGIPAQQLTYDSFPESITYDTIREESYNEFPFLRLGEYRNRILSVGGDKMFVHDFGDFFDDRAIDAIMQREYAKVGQNSRATAQINRVLPWIDGFDGTEVSIRVGGARTTADATDWTGYQTYTLGTSEKVDFRKRVNWAGFTIRCAESGVRVSGLDLVLNGDRTRR